MLQMLILNGKIDTETIYRLKGCGNNEDGF